MKHFFTLLLAILLLCPTVATAKKNDKDMVPQYIIEGAGGSSKSTRAVLVTIYSKKKDVTDAQLAAAAVHGVLFRNYQDKSFSGGAGATKTGLLSPAQEKEYVDFFEPFFANGDYMGYVSFVNTTRRVVKAGGEWKISEEVKVNESELIKLLNNQGIKTKGNLGSGW
ncbi:MAG: hypothetical protein K2N03_03465 [Muribaculaceae bacterium]|nr:hypothetical protein [Muribaculaceae bacterium]